ncbi:MAG: ATP-binding domain-containing protein, partial [Ruminococcus sp.]|nr:ATP-binding domain-containing protein [Ruminococcus sp.]
EMTQYGTMNKEVDFNDDFCYFPEYNQEAAAKLITDLFVNEASALGLDNVICISPLRDKGFCSAHELNNSIQARINPESPAKAQCKVKGTIFRVLDRVIQCQNIEVKTIYGNTVYISNGGIGKILSIKKEDSDYIFQIDFGEKRIVEFNRDNMLSVKLAYALTVHKSQGAEFESVIMPLFRYFGVAMNYRNMFYTAVTRAKKKFQIVGESECIYMCIRNNKITHRNTKLSFRIGQKMLSELF